MIGADSCHRADIWSRPGSPGKGRQEACTNNSHHDPHISGQPYVNPMIPNFLLLIEFFRLPRS